MSVYNVSKIDNIGNITAEWGRLPWNRIESLKLNNYMGNSPLYFPKVEAKLGYGEETINIIFRVQDKYVISINSEYQGKVWHDSCVEFFFFPDETYDIGYFNLEMNCGGTMLFQFQKERGKGLRKITKDDAKLIISAHSLPEIVKPEIRKEIVWTVEFALPFSVIKKYSNFKKPAKGEKWRANFYKCADLSSNPHWLTWAPVDRRTPDFHRPESFGILEFG